MIHHSLNGSTLKSFILLHSGGNKARNGKALLEPLAIFQQAVVFMLLFF